MTKLPAHFFEAVVPNPLQRNFPDGIAEKRDTVEQITVAKILIYGASLYSSLFTLDIIFFFFFLFIETVIDTDSKINPRNSSPSVWHQNWFFFMHYDTQIF